MIVNRTKAGNGSKDTAKVAPRAKLTVEDIIRLRAATLFAEKTIRSWARGGNVYTANAKSLEEAAAKLGIEVFA